MLDDLIGSIIESLEDNNLYENTVFVYSSDNGGWLDAMVGNFPYKGNSIAPNFKTAFSTMLIFQRMNKSSLISDNAYRW